MVCVVDLRLLFVLDVVDCASAFCAPYCETGGIYESANAACLPFQRALDCFVELLRLAKIDDVQISICRSYHQKLVSRIHSIDSILTVYRRNRRALSQVPVLYFLIPASRHQNRSLGAWHFYHLTTSNGRIMYGNLSLFKTDQINHSGCFVCANAKYLLSVLFGCY